MREALADAIARLPEREKLVVTLYYYEELTLREIGEVLGVTESRVSQLHTKAILRLKARLAGSAARARSLETYRRLGARRPALRSGSETQHPEEEWTPCLPPSPERSATSPSSATAVPARPRSSEALLFQAGKTNRLGSIEQGTTVSRLGRATSSKRQMSLSG